MSFWVLLGHFGEHFGSPKASRTLQNQVDRAFFLAYASLILAYFLYTNININMNISIGIGIDIVIRILISVCISMNINNNNRGMHISINIGVYISICTKMSPEGTILRAIERATERSEGASE